MLRIAIIIGSTRPNRKSEQVARWVQEVASRRKDAKYELVDLRDYDLPLFDEPNPPSRNQYTKLHTKIWSEKIASYDAFIFVTPEYNHGIPAVLKNAIDYLYYEWHDKAAGFVSYGSAGGARAVEQLRLVMGEVHVADVRPQVLLYNATDFENYTTFKPAEKHELMLNTMLDKLLAWGTAFQGMRKKQMVPAMIGKN
jgi:NAD(P)H-dependent FMN reductase